MAEPKDERATYHHGDLRRALIDATIEILGELDAGSFTLREAARRVGVNHRAAYRHFADKNAVLAAAAEQGYLDLVARMRSAQAQVAGLEDELFSVAHAYVVFALERPALFQLMLGPRLNEDGRFPELEAAVQVGYTLLRALIERVQSEHGLDGSLDDGVIALWSAVHGLATLTLLRRLRVRRSELAGFTRRALTPVIAGLLHRRPT